jgi:hypothetical protein
MANFNDRVAALINRYLRDASGTTANAKVESAFRAIQADRQKRCLNDSVTVAAEHYLFTRSVTGSNLLMGTAYFSASLEINLGYDIIKEIVKAAGGDIGVTDCATSEAHCWIRMWAHLGAGDGFGDRGETVPASPSPSDLGFTVMCWPYEAPAP